MIRPLRTLFGNLLKFDCPIRHGSDWGTGAPFTQSSLAAMPSKGGAYSKLNQSEEQNKDWTSDDTLELKEKWGGIVNFADGKIDGYKLDAVLRMGFFRVKSPVFCDPFVS